MTKQIILLVAVLLAGATGVQAQKIKGSDTVLPLSQKEAESYLRKHPGRTVIVTGGGSGVGLSALMEGTTDIAQSSRKIKFDEKQKMQAGGGAVQEVVVAYDALAIIVHPENRATNLTREQLEGIFTGKITNWKEVGGADLKIIPYARETSSGTYEFFKESVLKNKNYKSGILSMPATGAIVQSVSQTRGAIGYIGLAYLNKNIKAIHVSYDGGKTYAAPSVAAAKAGTYPIVRPLYYYYRTRDEKQVRPFIDFVLSAEGQKIVSDSRFIAL
jgi:phosphate transport system substrate-binding protein